jgi:hypothetical protein
LSATYSGNLWANEKNYRNQSDFTGFLQSQIDAGIMKLPADKGLWDQLDIGDPSPGNSKSIAIRAQNAAGVDKLFTKTDKVGLDWTDVVTFINEGAAPVVTPAPVASTSLYTPPSNYVFH